MGIEQNIFYVYEHLKKGSNIPFYVGKGKDNRAYKNTNRNKYWHNIVKKHNGFDVKIIANNLNEELALLVEIEKIDQLKKLNIKLCNLTNGGEGVSGYKFTSKQRKKCSESHIGKKLSDSQKEKLSNHFKLIERTSAWKKNISKGLTGKKKSKESVEKMIDSKSKPVFCLTEEKLFKSALIASNYYKINKTSITKACNGSRATANKKVWRYPTKKDLKCFPLIQN